MQKLRHLMQPSDWFYAHVEDRAMQSRGQKEGANGGKMVELHLLAEKQYAWFEWDRIYRLNKAVSLCMRLCQV